MQLTREIFPDIHFIGDSDRRLERFENMFPLPGGVSYNSYVITDEKTCLLDTVDASVDAQFFENLRHVLNGRPLDVLIIHHMEPDHCAAIGTLCAHYPDLQLYGTGKAQTLLTQFYGLSCPERFHQVKEGDTLCLGRHTLKFILAPMVHWPEVMMSLETGTGTLFAADAFGTFGALPGPLFADELNFEQNYMDEARRYYANIVGRFGQQVQGLCKKLAGERVRALCPLHGPIWRCNLELFLDKYAKWSAYEPEEKGVVVAYGSMYGNTENAAKAFAMRLSEQGVRNIRVYDVSKTDLSYIIADLFRLSHFALCAPTYNNGLYLKMQALLHDMGVLNLQNRTAALIGNGSWAPQAHKVMKDALAGMKNIALAGEPLVIKSRLTKDQLPGLYALADALAENAK